MGVERIALLVTVLAVAAMAASGAPFEQEGPGSGEGREGKDWSNGIRAENVQI